ncbi:class I SAM-dependent methyltransferase [Nocardioides hankookensis]|uniref:Class I SAM-dependent DNA methyltransferase n=1 Tax=Nocardioides hankookensis TaxID=443157 RepID=A0ABW1LFP6_9ACTN
MDRQTEELRDAHDVLADVYVERLTGLLDQMPIERAVLGLFAELVRDAGPGRVVGDLGCGTGRLAPYFSAQGFRIRGVDLSPEMVRVARRDHPDHSFEVGDLRALPIGDAELDGAVGWYSMMYLDPDDRALAFAELARAVKPGGYVATAYKMGDDTLRRDGKTLDLGIGFDIYWHSPTEVERRFEDAGFEVVFTAGRPADPDEVQPQGYLVARRA